MEKFTTLSVCLTLVTIKKGEYKIMSQFYLSHELEKHILFRIPLTPYFLYRDFNTKLFHIVEKELNNFDIFYEKSYKPYHYRFL